MSDTTISNLSFGPRDISEYDVIGYGGVNAKIESGYRPQLFQYTHQGLDVDKCRDLTQIKDAFNYILRASDPKYGYKNAQVAPLHQRSCKIGNTNAKCCSAKTRIVVDGELACANCFAKNYKPYLAYAIPKDIGYVGTKIYCSVLSQILNVFKERLAELKYRFVAFVLVKKGDDVASHLCYVNITAKRMNRVYYEVLPDGSHIRIDNDLRTTKYIAFLVSSKYVPNHSYPYLHNGSLPIIIPNIPITNEAEAKCSPIPEADGDVVLGTPTRGVKRKHEQIDQIADTNPNIPPHQSVFAKTEIQLDDIDDNALDEILNRTRLRAEKVRELFRLQEETSDLMKKLHSPTKSVNNSLISFSSDTEPHINLHAQTQEKWNG